METIRLTLWNGLGAKHAMTESALLARARQGDRKAYDVLVREHSPALRGFLLRRLPCDAVEDVLQEAFLAAWTALPLFEPRVRFKTWLYRIALNKAADWMRRAPMDADLDSAPIAAPDHWDQVNRAIWVKSLLRELPENQRVVLELYYWDDLTLEETARVLDRNLNTVKYQFYQAHRLALRLGIADMTEPKTNDGSEKGTRL